MFHNSMRQIGEFLMRILSLKSQSLLSNSCLLPMLTGPSLGSFVHCVRLYQKTGKLSADQVVKLREIGFDFNVQDSLWNTRCEELASYKEKHGDFFVPYSDYPVRLTEMHDLFYMLCANLYLPLPFLWWNQHFPQYRHCTFGKTTKLGDTMKICSARTSEINWKT